MINYYNFFQAKYLEYKYNKIRKIEVINKAMNSKNKIKGRFIDVRI